MKSIYILTAIAVLFLVGGFFCPPMGIIDGSVLTGVGELFGFGALGAVLKALDKGIDAKITKGNTTLELTNDDK